MPRSWKAILACVFLVAFLATGIGAGPVQAYTTYLITAWPAPQIASDLGGFSLQYMDFDHDGRFSLNELVPGSFSGVWAWEDRNDNGWWDPQPVKLPEIISVPTYGYQAWTAGTEADRVLDGDWMPDGQGGVCPCPSWEFGPRDVYTGLSAAGYDYYGYNQSPVPLPPSVFLLGAGLLGLAAARRKKRSGP